MPIYYALIARRQVVLCDYTAEPGDYESMLPGFLQGLPTGDTKTSYLSGRYLFHVMISGKITYMCVTEATFEKVVAYGYLQELRRQLLAMRLEERASIAGPYGLRGDLTGVLGKEMRKYSSEDQMTRMQSKMDQVKGVMTENIEKVMKRGEGLDDLTERSELLSNNSTKFHRNATKLRRKLWWKNFKLWACCLLVVLIILGIVVAIIALAATGKLKK